MWGPPLASFYFILVNFVNCLFYYDHERNLFRFGAKLHYEERMQGGAQRTRADFLPKTADKYTVSHSYNAIYM